MPPSAAKPRPSSLFLVAAAGDLQHREKCFLRDVHAADALHALLAFFLLFEELALARNVAAVALGQHVLADGADRLARDDTAADSGLQRDFKHLARDELA